MRIMIKNFVEELKWRGMIHDTMPGAEDHLMETMLFCATREKKTKFFKKFKIGLGLELIKTNPQSI